MRWQDAVDFAVLAVALYLLLVWGREARALRTFLGVLSLRVGGFAARQADLPVTAWVLDTASVVAVVLVLVVFQREIRRSLTRFDAPHRLARTPPERADGSLRAIVGAAFGLAEARRGALIVIVRHDPVEEWLTGGVPLGGEVSAEILEAIFRKVSPVHDGAAVVQGGRIARVAAILPLSEAESMPGAFGTRHRAAMGLSERCDATVIAVSEERGAITLFEEGIARGMATREELVRELQVLLIPQTQRSHAVSRLLTENTRLKAAALGLAAAIWGLLSLSGGTTVRAVLAPVELTNVPPGLRVVEQSASAIEVRVRGRSWIPDSVGGIFVVARFDLRRGIAGVNAIRAADAALDMPPGLVLEGVSPATLTIRLARVAGDAIRENSAEPDR
jgi:diadenylate cyclase